jgi:hypothetical protein
MKPHGAIVVREHAVEHERVQMDVEIQRPTERWTTTTAPLRPSATPSRRARRRRNPRTARMATPLTARHRS